MKEQLRITGTFKIFCGILIAIGIVTLLIGLRSDPQRAWSDYLITNYYFFSVAMGGLFFFVIQYISQAGWSAGFKRVSEAMMLYIPVASVLFILLYFGMHDLYEWSHKEILAGDTVVQHRSPFLNIPFFFLRMVFFFGLWIFFIYLLRRFSLKEDSCAPGDSDNIFRLFKKSEFYSRLVILIVLITFSLATIDWIKSVNTHWFSTIFALKNLVAAFLHGVSIMVLIVLILNRRGHFTFMNKYHLHDFSRYIFMFSIIWGYFWFSQFMIIWYGNIPEETIYYHDRWQGSWKILFYLNIIINWGIPFMVLLPVQTSRNKLVIFVVVLFLIAGQYIDLYFQVLPATTGKPVFGATELGIFAGFAGLFALVVATALSRANLVPYNHPYLEESLNHQF